jgi:hypothetical protein
MRVDDWWCYDTTETPPAQYRRSTRMSADPSTPPPSLPPDDARAEARKDALAGVVLMLLFTVMLLGGWAVLRWVDR